MVHRILGRAVVISVLAASGVTALALFERRASAFCRTTTCAVRKPPASCIRDPDTGCWLSGIPLTWKEPCVSYAVNVAASPRLGLDYDAALAIVTEAFSHWPRATCSDGFPSIAFASRPGLTCDRVEYNASGPNANAIIFRDDNWTHESTALALTTVAFNVRTGQILNADMEINTQLTAPADLPFVVTHESGHFAGLDHSPDFGAVMYFQYSGVVASTISLTDDDVAAICDAYPTSRVVPACDFEPPGGFATDCGGDVQAACNVAVLSASDSDARARWIEPTVVLAAGAVYGWRGRLGRRRRRRQESQAGRRPRSA
jgi:Matrixin